MNPGGLYDNPIPARFLAPMMEKSAQLDVGDARPPTFTVSTITSKVVVYAPAERADTLPLFLLYPYMYSVRVTSSRYIQTKVFRRTTVHFISSICSECINVLPRLNCTQIETGLRRRVRTPCMAIFLAIINP